MLFTTALARRIWLQCMVLGAVGLAAQPSLAAGFPEHTIKIVVPFAPGAGTDAIGRLVATKLAELLKTPVVVDNRVGA
ncbi:MAG: tripartite tricarboxylate transporter substrate binding protein, partial [Hydrogenophaga sp.]|nr:tripartite tricarboxylate transporter substrate binding protein [Hydrogenophaga sp.]